MNANRWWLVGLALLVLAVIVGGRLLWPSDAPAPDAVAPADGQGLRPLGSSQLPPLDAAGMVAPAPLAGTDSPLLPLPESTVDAAETMSHAREHGDPAAPPVVREVPPEAATAAELADPKAYQRYEARQNERLYNQYVKAADNEIPRLQADIARARAAGLPPEQIAEGEEKLRRIQAMRDQLQAEKGATPTAPAGPAAP